MQLGRDPEIELDIERVMMGDKRLRRGAARDGVQHRCLKFEITVLDEATAQRRDNPAAPAQRLAALRVHDQIEIALAVAQLDIGETMIFLGKRTQGLRQDRDGASVNGQLATRGAANGSLYPDQIADIEQANRRQPVRSEEVSVAEDLDLARGVVQVDEHPAVADR